MKIVFYVSDGDGLLDEAIELDPMDIEDYIDAVKKYGYEDEAGSTYKFSFAKMTKSGATIYLLTD